MPRRMLSGVPGLRPLGVTGTLCPIMTSQNVSTHCQLSPGEQNQPPALGITDVSEHDVVFERNGSEPHTLTWEDEHGIL